MVAKRELQREGDCQSEVKHRDRNTSLEAARLACLLALLAELEHKNESWPETTFMRDHLSSALACLGSRSTMHNTAHKQQRIEQFLL